MTDVIIQHLITEQKGMLVPAILLYYKWMSLGVSFFYLFHSSHQVSWLGKEDCNLQTQTGCKYWNHLFILSADHLFFQTKSVGQLFLFRHLFSHSALCYCVPQLCCSLVHFCFYQVQLPDKIVIYELNTDDISDMHYKVKVHFCLFCNFFINKLLKNDFFSFSFFSIA